MKKKERFNYTLSLLRKPYRIVTAFFFIYKNRDRILRKIRKIILGKIIKTYSSYKIYPPYLEKSYRKKIFGSQRFSQPALGESFSNSSLTACHFAATDKFLSWIKLAGRENYFSNNMEWEQKFEDTEDYESLHRWNWLLTKLTETKDCSRLKEWGEYHIYDWVARYGSKMDNSLKWNAYTTSERICNSIIFMEKVTLKYNEIIKLALSNMAFHVMNNLEYYGPKHTFNHIINNARALYFYGNYFGSSMYAKKAIKLIENELPGLITSDGFLREGSSHYHFLFTRWILEIFYVAQKFEDRDTVNMLKPYLEKLVRKCWFFLVFDKKEVRWEIPLFGDISPDCTPEWLVTLPYSPLALSLYSPTNKAPVVKRSGWSSLFENSIINGFSNLREFRDKEEEESIRAYSLSGWYRFDFKGTTLFLYVEPEGIPKCPGHFHSDTCSFCMYREGSSVLIDTGRKHYMNDDMGRYGLSARSHNSVQIDGLAPYPDRKYLDIWESICKKPIVSWSQEETSLQVEVKHWGFNRIYNDKVNHVRTFKVFSSHMIIEDYFEGNNKHFVESFFHWGKGLEIEPTDIDGQFRIAGKDEKYVIICEVAEGGRVEKEFGKSEVPAGWCSPEYGVRTPIWTLINKAKVTFPFRQRYIIKW